MVIDETVPHASQTTQTLPAGTSLGIPFHLVDQITGWRFDLG